MRFLLLLLVTLVLDHATAFVSPSRCRVVAATTRVLRIDTRQFVDLDDNTSSDTDPISAAKQQVSKLADDFFSSSLWRTILFTAPILFNPKFRSSIPTPAVAATVGCIYAYFDYSIRLDLIKTTLQPRRDIALRGLKQARTDRLSDMEVDVDEALESYKTALSNELEARILIPSLWVLEFEAQEHYEAARNYLGCEITSDCKLVKIDGEAS